MVSTYIGMSDNFHSTYDLWARALSWPLRKEEKNKTVFTVFFRLPYAPRH